MGKYVVYLAESSKKYRNEDDARKEQKMITNLGGKIYSCSGRMYKEGVYGVFDQKPPYLEVSKIGDVQFDDFEEVGEEFMWRKLRRKIEDTLRKEATPKNLVFWARILGLKNIPDYDPGYDPTYRIVASEMIPTDTLADKHRKYVVNPEIEKVSEKDVKNIIRILKEILIRY